MNRRPLILLGLVASVAASWVAMVLVPHLQLGALSVVNLEETGQDYPLALQGDAQMGREVYKASGCVYCHTQVVRGGGDAVDLSRSWGERRTVARDYIREQPAMLGTLRLGPDLANIGARTTNSLRLLLRLYNPRILTPESTMPRHAFLFQERLVQPGEGPSPQALPLDGEFAPPAGVEVVPKPEATRLVKYLESLRSDTWFFEVFRGSPAGTLSNAPPIVPTLPLTAPGNPPSGSNLSPAVP
jgi:cytochrome c oxidase cbb3-type subunit 2